MKVTARAQSIGIALYSLPFLAVIVLSLFVWTGNIEIIVASVALLPAVLYFLRVRWSRYLVGAFSALALLTCSIVPITRGTAGTYFWAIWCPIWLLFAFSCFISFAPPGPTQLDRANP